jgi:hypothetical protein
MKATNNVGYNPNNENEDQYIFRICGMKESCNMTWQEVADIINNALGNNYSESAYRKKYQAFHNGLKTCEKQVFSNDEYLKKIQDERRELEKERQKFYATKIEANRNLRHESRFELFYENVKDAIQTLPMPNVTNVCYGIGGKEANYKEYVLTLADIHAGANFSVAGNSYSLSECERRFCRLLAHTKHFVCENNVDKLHVVELADTVQGILRMSDLQLNETSVVEAVVFVSRLIAMFLNELSSVCNVEYYHAPSGNHSQTRPLGTKASEIATEDVEYVIGNYIKDMLANNPLVNVNLNFGQDEIFIPIFDFNIIAMHGHTVKNVDTVLKDMSVKHHKIIDYIFMGHYHNGKLVPGCCYENYDSEVLLCPSFQGTDPYAFNKLGYSSKAACNIYIFDPVYGRTGTEKIILN